MGNIGSASIATIMKDLRRRLMGADPAFEDWRLPEHYSVQQVGERLQSMIDDELLAGRSVDASLGFLIAGYADDNEQPEAWQVAFEPDAATVVTNVAAPDTSGWAAFGQPQATDRLLHGYDNATLPLLMDAGLLAPEDVSKAIDVLNALEQPVVIAPMPFLDAISAARFLVEVTAGYSHFNLGPNTVGGPTGIAGISRHEGFKWIERKHYYAAALNPEDPHHDH